jgi:hypothetical protein
MENNIVRQYYRKYREVAIRKASMKGKNEINVSRYPGYSWQWIDN